MKRRDFLKGLAVAPAIAFLGLPDAAADIRFGKIDQFKFYDNPYLSQEYKDILELDDPVARCGYAGWKNWNAGRVLNDAWVGRFKGAAPKGTGV